jgi:ERCC4-related helicase
LKRNKPNDGTPENYYIDLVLYIGDNPTADTQVIEYEVPRNRETQKQKTKIRNVINERLKTLSSKKRKRKRATKSHRKNVSELKNLKKRYKRTRKPQSKQDINNKILERFNRFNSALDRDYNNGLMTEEQYIYRKNQLYDNYLKNGGII